MPILGTVASSFELPLSSPYGSNPPVAGYTLWLDGEDTSNITQSGGLVSQWSDKSGNSRHFTQSTGANQPATGTRRLNNRNVLDFDGTNDLMFCPSSENLFNYFHGSTGGTAFFVGVRDSGNGMMFGNSTTSTAIGVYTDLSGFMMITNGSSGYPRASAATGISIPTNTGFQTAYKFQGNAAMANRVKASLNGGAFLGTASNEATFLPDGQAASNPMILANGSYDGAIAEVVFYSGILSDGNITSTVNYLTAKWGL